MEAERGREKEEGGRRGEERGGEGGIENKENNCFPLFNFHFSSSPPQRPKIPLNLYPPLSSEFPSLSLSDTRPLSLHTRTHTHIFTHKHTHVYIDAPFNSKSIQKSISKSISLTQVAQ